MVSTSFNAFARARLVRPGAEPVPVFLVARHRTPE
jgi:hypothetical protein